MNVLITGGFGFVGGRLGQRLQRAGHHVVLGTRSARQVPSWLPGAEVRRTEWHDSDALTACCHSVDVVVHAAGMNAQDSAAAPASAIEVNAVATARLAHAARNAGVRRVVHLSTAHVYSGALVGRITEETCARNLHPYAASHRAGEDAVRFLLAATGGAGTSGVVVRLSNAFGAPAAPDAPCWSLLVNDLCRQAIVDGRMVLRTSGLQERDFLPMDDACAAIGLLATTATPLPADGVVNVGAGASMTVLAMATLIQERATLLLGRAPELVRPMPVAGEAAPPLEFQIERLRALGYRAERTAAVEIDELLRFCQGLFGRGAAAS